MAWCGSGLIYLSLKCSPPFLPPFTGPIFGPFFMEKEDRQTANPLQIKGFPICLYYAIRAHLRHPGPAKRGGRENRLFHSRPLQRRFYLRHLCSRYHHRPAGGGQEDGWGAGSAAVMRNIPRAGMRWHPLQSLTQTQGKTVWVRTKNHLGAEKLWSGSLLSVLAKKQCYLYKGYRQASRICWQYPTKRQEKTPGNKTWGLWCE